MDKNNKATINPINEKDNKCFLWVVTVTLNEEEIGKNSEQIMKIKPFIKNKTGKEYIKKMIGKKLRKII